MSRSFKKHPFNTDGSPGATKNNKRIANSRVRNHEDIPSGKAYKKVSESYDIHDWRNRWTKEEAIKDYESGVLSAYIYKHYPTLKSWLNYWAKCSKRK